MTPATLVIAATCLENRMETILKAYADLVVGLEQCPTYRDNGRDKLVASAAADALRGIQGQEILRAANALGDAGGECFAKRFSPVVREYVARRAGFDRRGLDGRTISQVEREAMPNADDLAHWGRDTAFEFWAVIGTHDGRRYKKDLWRPLTDEGRNAVADAAWVVIVDRSEPAWVPAIWMTPNANADDVRAAVDEEFLTE